MNLTEIKNFSRIYETERKKIDIKLQNLLKGREPLMLYKPASYILESSGKRLRPLLVLFSSKASGGKFIQVYNAALAVEMLHNFTLVHDDIMDKADLRRGRETLHKKYDINTAILAGDSLLAVAYEYLLKDCNVNAKKALASFTNGLIEVCEGQSLDTDFEKRKNVSIDEYITMITKKTAMLLKMCCEIGSLLVDANPRDIKILSDYGLNLGIAFQIQDDLLDIIGDQKKFGKKVGGDLIEGKKTFLFLRALDKSKGNNKKALLRVIKHKGIKPSEVNIYKKIYEELGVIQEAKKEIESYTITALKSISKLSDKKNIGLFYWLANSLIKRDQ
ncbi:MAG TPA: polyprenyl synthetase family protein [Ignavibacteriaceae bacterium]|nr:polyprenyl synthetase family protein [Ignavibacteriaceae bacterium]